MCSVFYVYTVIWAELPEINLMMITEHTIGQLYN